MVRKRYLIVGFLVSLVVVLMLLTSSVIGLLWSYYGFTSTRSIVQSQPGVIYDQLRVIFDPPPTKEELLEDLSKRWVVNSTYQLMEVVSSRPVIVYAKLPPRPVSHIMSPFSHEYQKLNNCGPAATAIVLRYFGHNLDQFETASVLKGSGKDKNVSPREIVEYLEDFGLQAQYQIAGRPELIEQLIARDIPVIAHQWLVDPAGDLIGHYRAIKGYDQNRQVFIASDSYTGANFTIAYSNFIEWWKPFNNGYIVVFPESKEAEVQSILRLDWQWESNVSRARKESESLPEGSMDKYDLFNLGTNRLLEGDYLLAAEAYDKALEYEFPHYFLWYQFGPLEAYLNLGRYEKVLSLANDLLQEAGPVEEAYYYQGLVYEARGQIDEAESFYRQAMEANGRFVEAREALEGVRAKNGE